MIELFHVCMRYGRDQQALTDLNLKIEKGEFVFITGASGAGKTTLLKLLFAQEAPYTGQVMIDGKNVSHLKSRELPALRRRIGVVFQDFKLIHHWTVYQNVAFVLELAGLPGREVHRRVWQALKMVHLHHKLESYPLKLSGGEQQRVAIARAFIAEPAILLADEPTGNLDSKTGAEIMGLFNRLSAAGNTIILVTHEADIAEHARRIIHIRDGRVENDIRKAA